ncbi:hypothetical protein [Halalkalicoccus ordinarius]|uniref:hypothetical protein n=1 Tax=Halalkalicoccus ordinarius TaxID=3116651 RepID=UPI00300F705D
MYTGKTERPCCLCRNPETGSRIDLPPRAITHMRHAGAIAWQDVVGEVSIHFCADDWALVRELVLEMGLNPLSRCNVAYASFDLREDFEALLNATREGPDHAPIERRMRERSETVLSSPDEHELRDRVEARIVGFVLEDEPERSVPE